MRVVIDATPLALPPTGIGTYLRDTIAACGRTPRGHEIVALSMGGRSETAGLAEHLDSPPGVVRRHRRVRGSFVLRRLVNASPVPLLEPIAGRAGAFVGSEWLYPRQRSGVRGAIVYDLVPLRFPEWTTPETAALHGRKLADVKRCDVVVCISEATAGDVRTYLGIDAARVRVARPGVGDRFRDAAPVPPAALAGRPYVASLCTHEPRKNLVTLVEAFALLRAQHPELALVLVGSAGWDGGAAADAVRAPRPGRRRADHRLPRRRRGAGRAGRRARLLLAGAVRGLRHPRRRGPGRRCAGGVLRRSRRWTRPRATPRCASVPATPRRWPPPSPAWWRTRRCAPTCSPAAAPTPRRSPGTRPPPAC